MSGVVDSCAVSLTAQSDDESRAVLVTGASRGIGRAIARAFAGRGDRVAVHWGSSRERAEAVLAELPGEGDRRSPSLTRGRRGLDEVVHRGRW